jgi:DNA-binding CsgD family transcriptional regulator
MEKNLEKLYADYYNLISSIDFNVHASDYAKLERHIDLLEKLNVVESSSVSVFDLYKKEHIYISRGFESQLGWDISKAHEVGNDYMDARIHPDDLVNLMEAANYFIKLGLYQIANIQWKDYKMINDYRALNAKGEYIRVIEQHVCLEMDRKGNYWLDLSILDINPDQDIAAPFRCRLLNFKTGELFKFPSNETQNDVASPKLSGREKEVLKLIAVGLISKQIADKLFISINTVNTHRQRIIEKLNVTNTAEAIRYASEVGWL